MIGALGLVPAGLTPIENSSGAAIFATGSGAQLYVDGSGNIVDANGNSQDPSTGDPYQDETGGSYTIPPNVWMQTSPSMLTPPIVITKNWAPCERASSPGWWQSALNLIQNAYDGTLTQAQKSALISQEAACLTNAGMDSVTAMSTATQDVTAALIAAGADPSQSTGLPRLPGMPKPPTLPTIPSWGWLALGALGLVVVVSAVKR